jgi:hypothetical protein
MPPLPAEAKAEHFIPYKVTDGSAAMIERFRRRFAMPLVNPVETLFKPHLFTGYGIRSALIQMLCWL